MRASPSILTEGSPYREQPSLPFSTNPRGGPGPPPPPPIPLPTAICPFAMLHIRSNISVLGRRRTRFIDPASHPPGPRRRPVVGHQDSPTPPKPMHAGRARGPPCHIATARDDEDCRGVADQRRARESIDSSTGPPTPQGSRARAQHMGRGVACERDSDVTGRAQRFHQGDCVSSVACSG